MKMTQRDKMILLVFLSILVVVGGIFGLIKPKMKDIDTHEGELAKVKADWEAIEVKLNEIQPLKDGIDKTYKDSKALSDKFVDVSTINTSYKLDQFMQPYVDECNLEVNTVELGATGTKDLGYYYFTPSVLSSSMFDAADINGKYQNDINNQMAESNALSARTAETVILTQYGVSAKGTREDIWKFMEKINSLNTTILIDSVNIADYTFGEEKAKLEGVPVDEHTSEVTFVISLYSVFEMDEPVVD